MLKLNKEEKDYINFQINFFKFLKRNSEKLCKILSNIYKIKEDIFIKIGAYDNEYVEFLTDSDLFFTVEKTISNKILISRNRKEGFILNKKDKNYKFFIKLLG